MVQTLLETNQAARDVSAGIDSAMPKAVKLEHTIQLLQPAHVVQSLRAKADLDALTPDLQVTCDNVAKRLETLPPIFRQILQGRFTAMKPGPELQRTLDTAVASRNNGQAQDTTSEPDTKKQKLQERGDN